ncbi:uncharacterized protein C8Q71DRAFT_859984 [Rhodofomes roseus]|uniref:SET domain-containing protein n=1 Tax=Rhodofomes roseus TaxID=34475 RepID=A0ABQ8K902_9APHY|nr:uncharacterized protein C8Q71DRAFT_859984 [Rhodofomes roseus]KAH9833708.1 hypothetical protein C8Q71DRAFT_859984 [Rhodofomes roseus]
MAFNPQDPDFLHTLDIEQMIDLAVHLGLTPEAMGDVLADADINYRHLSDIAEEQGSKTVMGIERLPRLILSMPPEEQAEAAIKYKEWLEGESDGGPVYKPKTSSRATLVAAQIAARKEQEKQFAAPASKVKARTIAVVTGFRKHTSKAPWNELEPVLFSEMMMRQVTFGRALTCRIIAPCSSLYSVQTVVEDQQGTAYDLSFYNYPTTFEASPQYMDILFPKGAVLLIRDPVLMPSQQNTNPLIRVDSPTDLVVFAPYTQMLPDVHFATEAPTSPSEPLETMQTEDYWRVKGNDLFKYSQWFPAAVAYSRGLEVHPDSLVLRLNRAEAYLRLEFYSGTLYDAQSVLSTPDLSPAFRNKALLRAARAEYGRRNYASARQLFQQHRVSSSNNAEDATWIRRCEERLRENSIGKYDWARLFEECQHDSRLDAADYTGPVEVKTIPGRGRGIVVTRDVSAGELLMVSKALSFVEEKDFRADVWRTALNFKTSRFMTRAQSANVAKVAQTVYGNPDIYDQLLHLYAGPDYPLPPATPPPARLDPQRVDPLQPTVDIDIDHLEAICLYNTFDQYSLCPTGSEVIEDDRIRRSPNALHLLPSLLNHSCAGNARARAFGDVLAVRAVAPIRAGEEVTVPYVSTEKGYRDRVAALKKYFPEGQACECSVCEMDRADGEEKLDTREELLVQLPSGPLFKEPMVLLRTWESALEATHAPSRGPFRPALVRLVHSIGEQLRRDNATRAGALETNIRGLVRQGFRVTDTRSDASLKRKLKDVLPVDTADLSICVDVERGLTAMLRIAQQFRAEANVVQAKRWLKAAQKVDDVEYGGGRELFLLKEATILGGFGMKKFAETVL